MEVGALDGLHNQQTLWLCDNPFKTLNALLFARETVPSISEFFLWGKHWTCDCKLKWLKQMQESNSVIQDPHLMIYAEPEVLQRKACMGCAAFRSICLLTLCFWKRKTNLCNCALQNL
ncbi:uncharacterized protein LOC143458942 [Clavelina lepadiformis]|uniref:uncharacterized protein LOC143458942 n=1 Tax=Clavelina lepadiformis TaxID=159417 RepID=UPI004041BB35